MFAHNQSIQNVQTSDLSPYARREASPLGKRYPLGLTSDYMRHSPEGQIVVRRLGRIRVRAFVTTCGTAPKGRSS